MEQWLQQLIQRGLSQNGLVTYGDLDAVAPSEFLEGPLFDWVVDQLVEAGIALIDDEERIAPPPPLDPPKDIYRRDSAFEQRLRDFGIPFTDVMVSFEENGSVFDAELIVSGEQALVAWLALRNAVPVTGMWPVIKSEIKQSTYGEIWPEQLAQARLHARWWEQFQRDHTIPPFQLTPDMIRADAAANIAETAKVPPTPWTFRRFQGQTLAPPEVEGPDELWDGPEPDFATLFANTGPFRAHKQGGGHPDYPPFPFVRIRLYPTATPWEVFAFSPFGGWNDCPWPDEQLTMLRHWHTEYGAEIVSIPGDWYELFIPRPPRSRHQAQRLIAEMNHFGDETFYAFGGRLHGDPVEAVRMSHYWYFWWD